MRCTLILAAFILSACGSGSSSTPASKPLFSLWTNTQNANTQLDLTSFQFNVGNPITIHYFSNAGCNCTLTIIGDEASGHAYLSACTHFGPVNYCTNGTIDYAYTNSNATLTLCEVGQSCSSYQ